MKTRQVYKKQTTLYKLVNKESFNMWEHFQGVQPHER